jgi:sarcosine oxidase delta subunit
LGWSLSIPSIKRKTAKGLPLYRDYEDSDTFVLSGAEDLVPVLDKNDARQKHDRGDYEMERYRPRTEGLFARIERWVHKDGGVHWRSVSKENITSIYGFSEKHRVVDPDDKDRVSSGYLRRRLTRAETLSSTSTSRRTTRTSLPVRFSKTDAK